MTCWSQLVATSVLVGETGWRETSRVRSRALNLQAAWRCYLFAVNAWNLTVLQCHLKGFRHELRGLPTLHRWLAPPCVCIQGWVTCVSTNGSLDLNVMKRWCEKPPSSSSIWCNSLSAYWTDPITRVGDLFIQHYHNTHTGGCLLAIPRRFSTKQQKALSFASTNEATTRPGLAAVMHAACSSASNRPT